MTIFSLARVRKSCLYDDDNGDDDMTDGEREMIYLTYNKSEAKTEMADRKSWASARIRYELRKHETGAWGIWVSYTNCNFAHWARNL